SWNVSASSGSSSSPDCKAIGNDAANFINTWMSGGQLAIWYANLGGAVMAGGTLSGVTLGAALPGMPAIGTLGSAQQSLDDALLKTAKHVGVAAYSALAEGLCE